MSSLDYLDLCRLCLVKDRVSVPIFEDEGDVRQIFLKITACLPVKVGRDDKLPKKICDDCVYKVELFYQFWNTTANAEKQLLQWLGEVGGLEEKQGYVTDILNQNVMKQERNSENRLEGSLMQVSGHPNNMDINMMDENMTLSIPMMIPTGNQQISVPMDSVGNTVQAVPGPSTQASLDQVSQSQVAVSSRQDEEDETSDEDDNTDDDCDNEGLPVKEESEDDPNSSRNLEPATFVNVSLCDEAGPSGLQQQKISEMSEIAIPQTSDGDPKTEIEVPKEELRVNVHKWQLEDIHKMKIQLKRYGLAYVLRENKVAEMRGKNSKTCNEIISLVNGHMRRVNVRQLPRLVETRKVRILSDEYINKYSQITNPQKEQEILAGRIDNCDSPSPVRFEYRPNVLCKQCFEKFRTVREVLEHIQNDPNCANPQFQHDSAEPYEICSIFNYRKRQRNNSSNERTLFKRRCKTPSCVTEDKIYKRKSKILIPAEETNLFKRRAKTPSCAMENKIFKRLNTTFATESNIFERRCTTPCCIVSPEMAKGTKTLNHYENEVKATRLKSTKLASNKKEALCQSITPNSSNLQRIQKSQFKATVSNRSMKTIKQNKEQHKSQCTSQRQSKRKLIRAKCPKSSKDLGTALILNQIEEHSAISVTCKDCLLKFDSLRNLLIHRARNPSCAGKPERLIEGSDISDIEDNERKYDLLYSCPVCTGKFISKQMLIVHKTRENHWDCSRKIIQNDHSYVPAMKIQGVLKMKQEAEESVIIKHEALDSCEEMYCAFCAYRVADITEFNLHFQAYRQTESHCCTCNACSNQMTDYFINLPVGSLPPKPFCLRCSYASKTPFDNCLKLLTENLICRKCMRSIPNPAYMKFHNCTSDHNSPLLKCPLCSFTLQNLTPFYHHIIKHNDIQVHACKECNKPYKTWRGLHKHLKKKHVGMKFEVVMKEAAEETLQRFNNNGVIVACL